MIFGKVQPATPSDLFRRIRTTRHESSFFVGGLGGPHSATRNFVWYRIKMGATNGIDAAGQRSGTAVGGYRVDLSTLASGFSRTQ